MRWPTPPTGPAGAGITNTAPRPATTPATELGSHDQRSTTAVLVLHRRSSRHVSGRLEWSAVVGPFERSGGGVVVGDEGDELGDEVGAGDEVAVLEQAAGQDREEQFDLVQPGGVRRGVV